MRVRRLIADEKISADGQDAKEAAGLVGKLQHQGVDITWLMGQRDRVRQLRGLQVEQMAKSIGESLRDQKVTLTGYVIPSSVDDEGRLTEFFLVPTTAACSHEDPPPRLQVVFISIKQSSSKNYAGIVVSKLIDQGGSGRRVGIFPKTRSSTPQVPMVSTVTFLICV